MNQPVAKSKVKSKIAEHLIKALNCLGDAECLIQGQYIGDDEISQIYRAGGIIKEILEEQLAGHHDFIIGHTYSIDFPIDWQPEFDEEEFTGEVAA